MYFIWRVEGWFSLKNSNFRRKKIFHYILFHKMFLCYYCCSINLQKQSEHSGLRPDTSSLVCLRSVLVVEISCKTTQECWAIGLKWAFWESWWARFNFLAAEQSRLKNWKTCAFRSQKSGMIMSVLCAGDWNKLEKKRFRQVYRKNDRFDLCFNVSWATLLSLEIVQPSGMKA